MANNKSSYTGAPLTARDFTRLALGDRSQTNPIFSDAEVDAAVAGLTYPTLAAAALADSRAAELANKADTKRIGKTTLTFKEQSSRWAKIADRLRAVKPGNFAGGDGTGQRTGGIMFGGLTRAEVESLRTDTEFEPFSFEVGMDDIPGGGSNRDDDDC